LVVPKGSHNAYWLHPVFGKFNIEEMDEYIGITNI
jgi:hypothetical protein